MTHVTNDDSWMTHVKFIKIMIAIVYMSNYSLGVSLYLPLEQLYFSSPNLTNYRMQGLPYPNLLSYILNRIKIFGNIST